MIALDAAQVDRDLGFERGVDRLGQIMPQQHVFGRDGRIRFELEHPMSVGPLQGKQRTACRIDAAFDRGITRNSFGSTTVTVRPTFRSQANDEISRPIAGPDRAFNGRGQSGLGPIAGENEIAPAPSAPPGAWRSRRAWPRRSRGARARSARAAAPWEGRRRWRPRAKSPAPAPRAGIEQTVGGADRDRQPIGERRRATRPCRSHADDGRQVPRAARCGNAHSRWRGTRWASPGRAPGLAATTGGTARTTRRRPSRACRRRSRARRLPIPRESSARSRGRTRPSHRARRETVAPAR